MLQCSKKLASLTSAQLRQSGDSALVKVYHYSHAMRILQASSHKKGQLVLPFWSCPSYRQVLNCASQHSDWRRWVAALLGRFLPKLRAAGNSGLFSWVVSSRRAIA
jgi:hypothetical protein